MLLPAAMFLLVAAAWIARLLAGGDATPSATDALRDQRAASASIATPLLQTFARQSRHESIADGAALTSHAATHGDAGAAGALLPMDEILADGRLYGRVVDHLGQPVADATVVLRYDDPCEGTENQPWQVPRRARSAANGRFEITAEGFPGEAHATLMVDHRRYLDTITLETSFIPGSHQELGDLAFLEPGATVRGTLVDDRDRPVVNASVGLLRIVVDNPLGMRGARQFDALTRASGDSLAPGTTSITERSSTGLEWAATSADGSFVFDLLPAGEYRLATDEYRLASPVAAVHIARADEIIDLGTVAIAPGNGSISGTAIDERGRVVAGARIDVGPYSTQTDAAGHFHISGDETGPHVLMALWHPAGQPRKLSTCLLQEVFLDDRVTDVTLHATGVYIEFIDDTTGDVIEPLSVRFGETYAIPYAAAEPGFLLRPEMLLGTDPTNLSALLVGPPGYERVDILPLIPADISSQLTELTLRLQPRFERD